MNIQMEDIIIISKVPSLMRVPPAQFKKKGLRLSSLSCVHLHLPISGFESCKTKLTMEKMESQVTYRKHRKFLHLEGLPSQKKPLFVGKLRNIGRKITRLVYPR